MKKKKISILHLEITSWQGISIGATHYYGRITFPFEEKEKDIELGFQLTETDVRNLNRKERDFYALSYRTRYHVGERSIRFDTQEEIKKVAIEYYGEHLKNKYPLFVCGESGVIEPQEILGSNFESSKQKELVKKINTIAKKYDYDDDGDTKYNLNLYKEWKPLWKKLTGETWS